MHPIVNYFNSILEELINGVTVTEVIEKICSRNEFSYLNAGTLEQEREGASSFSKTTKSAAFLREALNSAPRCSICNAILHQRSIQIDHIVRRQDGGAGDLNNAQLAHPYCNSTYKN
ncbi:MAG: hypothetical protein DCF32_20845 [Leptolyngbya sp.]|nr:MAG: hypothetical protein DCF32_20845 [Leptolyngbya sp.]